MIIVINPSKLARQPFFQALMPYLETYDDVTLRMIKQAFPEVKDLEKSLENYIQAGYIRREHRRYFLTVKELSSIEGLVLNQEIFVDTESSLYAQLKAVTFEQDVIQPTNKIIIRENVDFLRENMTLSSYFYKVREGLPLSEKQRELYRLLGDVNPTYALKHMTSFLVKLMQHTEMTQRRPDIFLQALVMLGYVAQGEDQTYRLAMRVDEEPLIFQARL